MLERIGSDDDLLSAPMRRGSPDGEASSDSAWSPTLIILTKAFWTNCRYDGRGQGQKLGACWLVRRRGGAAPVDASLASDVDSPPLPVGAGERGGVATLPGSDDHGVGERLGRYLEGSPRRVIEVAMRAWRDSRQRRATCGSPETARRWNHVWCRRGMRDRGPSTGPGGRGSQQPGWAGVAGRCSLAGWRARSTVACPNRQIASRY